MTRTRALACLALVGGAVLATGSPPAGAVSAPGIWLTGDTHVHTDHSSDGSAPRQLLDQQGPGDTSVGTQIAAARRRALDFLPITDHRTYSQHWDPQWTSNAMILVPGEEADGSPHANVIGAADELVDGANPVGSPAYRHVQQSIWDVHAQHAVWQTNHPDDGEMNADGTLNANASAVGIDQVEIFNTGNPEPKLDYAENRWNAGYRFGAVAASDNHFSEIDAVAGPGLPATGVLASNRSERGILDGFFAGRTAVSRGTPDSPSVLLDADLDGDGTFETVGGDERRATAGRKVTLRVRVDNGAGATVYLYRSPGRSVAPLATLRPVAPAETFLVPLTVPTGVSWYRVEVRRAGGVSGVSDVPNFPDFTPTDPSNQLQAATSPVFLYTDRPATPKPELPAPPTTGRDSAQLVEGVTGAFSGFADVATVGAVSHVVAERHGPGRTSVVYRRVTSSGSGPAVELAASSPAARFPRVAARGDSVWVTWQDERAGQLPHHPVVYLRHSADGGRTWAPEVRVTDGKARAERPVVALLPTGAPVVAWTDNRNGAFDVLVQRIGVDRAPVDVAAPGKVTSPGNPVDDRTARYPASVFPSLAVAPSGAMAVGWEDDRFDPDPLWTGQAASLDGPASGGTSPDDYEILVARLPAGASVWSHPTNASRNAKACDRHATLVFDRAGTLHVGWDTRVLQAAGANLSLRATSSRDGGATYATVQPVAVAPSAMSQRPRLALDPDGTVRMVWYDTRTADWRWKVFTATGTSSGWSAARQLTGAANGTWPAVSGGRVVFSSDRSAQGQRDRTEQVFALDVVPVQGSGDADPVAPRGALPTTGGGPPLPAVLLVVAGGLLYRRVPIGCRS